MPFEFHRFTGKGIRIALIDSGIDDRHPDLRGSVIGGMELRLDDNGRIRLGKDFRDSVGHGTACASIIKGKAPEAELYAIKILDEKLATSGEVLIAAIKYAVDKGFRVINLSLGTTNRRYKNTLYKVCNYAVARGCIIVSAQHNSGVKSFPAFFDNTIGVAPGNVEGKYDYYFRDNHPIQCIAQGGKQRAAWKDSGYRYVSSSSFATPHMTGLVALILESNPSLGFNGVMQILKENAQPGNTSVLSQKREIKKLDFAWLGRAVIFPFQHEFHPLVQFRDMLDFQLAGVVDIAKKGLIGKDVGEVISGKKTGLKIGEDLTEALKGADSLILGELDDLIRQLKKDLFAQSIGTALEAEVNVFSLVPSWGEHYRPLLERMKQKGLRFEFPYLTWEEVKEVIARYNRQDIFLNAPVVAVLGIGSQGKNFCTELVLRKGLLQKGYKVGQISTNPQCQLFGFDSFFPLNRDRNGRLPVDLFIPFLQGKLREIDEREPDIIIVGGQSPFLSPLLPPDAGKEQLRLLAFLLGTSPDALILSIDNNTTETGMQHHVQMLKGLTGRKVIGIALWQNNPPEHLKCPDKYRGTEKFEKAGKPEKAFNIPVCDTAEERGAEKLAKVVVDYFSYE